MNWKIWWSLLQKIVMDSNYIVFCMKKSHILSRLYKMTALQHVATFQQCSSNQLLTFVINNYINKTTFPKLGEILIANFGAPQGSTLWPHLFNLCVADMTKILSESQRIQYADDFTICRSCKVKYLKKCSDEVENELHAIEQWPQNTNLVCNSKKTPPTWWR